MLESWHRQTGRLWSALALLILVTLLVACGGASDGSEGAVPEVPGGTSAAGTGTTGAMTDTVGLGPTETAGEAPATTAEPAPEGTSTEAAPGGAVTTTETITGTDTTTGTTGTSASTAAPGTIRVAVVRGAMIETMRKLADQYEQENPGTTVQVEEEPEGGAFEALIAAGNQPDIIVASFGSQIGRLAATQAAIPLEEMEGAQDIFASVDEVTAQQLYGHNYYIPLGADVTMLIYNKQLFEEAGLDPNKAPETWAEFLQAAEKIQGLPDREGGNKIYGTVFWNDALTWGGWYWNMLQPIYLNANGGECRLLNRLGNEIVFDDPNCGMEQFFDFAAKAQRFAPPTMERSFFSRSVGMWPQYGYSWEPNLKEAQGQPMVIGEDVGVAPVPVPNAGDKSFTTYGGRALMILKSTPERQQNAWGFIRFLMEPEKNLVFLKELGYLPTLSTLKEDPYFQEPARKPFVDALQNAVMPEQFAAADDVANAILGVYQEAVVQGTMQPPDAVKAAAEQARAALQRAGSQ